MALLSTGWEAVHPTIVYFPIALLLLAPIFILIGAVVSPPRGRPFMISALILLGLGTAGLFVAIPTGEAAARYLLKSGGAGVVDTHQNLAFEARGIFVMLLVLYIGVLLVPQVLHQSGRLLWTVLPLAFLILYSAGAVVLVNAAQEGERLAHKPAAVASPSPQTHLARDPGTKVTLAPRFATDPGVREK